MKSRLVRLVLLLALVLGLSAFLWLRFHSVSLGLQRVEALAEAGRFEDAEAQLAVLARRISASDNPELADELALRRARIALARGEHAFLARDKTTALAAFDQVIALAPGTPPAFRAAEIAWHEYYIRDPHRALELFDTAYPPPVTHPSYYPPEMFDQTVISGEYLDRPRYALFEVYPDENGSGFGTTMADPESALQQLDLWIKDHPEQSEPIEWAFHLSHITGDWNRACGYLQKLGVSLTPDDMLFAEGITDGLPAKGYPIPEEDLEEGDTTNCGMTITVLLDGKPIENAVLCLQYIDGRNISSSSTTYSLNLHQDSISRIHPQIIAAGRTDASGKCVFNNLYPVSVRVIAYLYQKNLDPDWFDYHFEQDGPADIYLRPEAMLSRELRVERAHVLTVTGPPQGALLSENPTPLEWTIASPSGAAPLTGASFELYFMGRSNPLIPTFFGGKVQVDGESRSCALTRDLSQFAGLEKALKGQGGAGWDRVHLLEPRIHWLGDEKVVCRGGTEHLVAWSEDNRMKQPSGHALQWAWTMIDTFHPEGNPKLLVESADEFLERYPDEYFSAWIRFMRGLGLWQQRNIEAADKTFENLLVSDTAQTLILQAAGKAIRDVRDGMAEPPPDWRYAYLTP